MEVEFPDSTDKLGFGVKAVSDEITNATPQQGFEVMLEVSKVAVDPRGKRRANEGLVFSLGLGVGGNDHCFGGLALPLAG